MFNLIVHYLARKLGEDSDTDSEDEDSGGFAGSALDWSVNYSHGTAGNAEAAREMAQIQEKVELLDDDDRFHR